MGNAKVVADAELLLGLNVRAVRPTNKAPPSLRSAMPFQRPKPITPATPLKSVLVTIYKSPKKLKCTL
ncbi:hypothetical protein DPMN_107596 [Dreissena polymorpha]|uniref:Uncharacterized protein n=1 Tax=Dreissena polymorpha TaxID=45954 RepID=A0A9D4K705_DREPO|nr:hypothetical protein DPMN_107596 [Dreissena polymorpha]